MPPRRIVLAASLLAILFGPGDHASASFSTGFSGPEVVSSDTGERDRAIDEARAAGAKIVRLNAGWSGIASSVPSDATDPGDPAYHFGRLDAAVESASKKGLEPLVTVGSAPAFAEGKDRPGSAAPGTWKPSGTAFGEFGQALAARYSGSFQGLPRVRFFQAWNEPNLSNYLTPQYVGKREVAAEIYRKLLNGFYEGVKSVNESNVVVTGGTAPYGDAPGGQRTRPLTFLRDLLCVSGEGRSKAKGCRSKARFDVLAHHPINTSGGPTKSAIHPDDASTPDFKYVRSVLREAERRHTIATPGKHPLWATEIWWESNPPDRKRGLPLATQARYLEQALYLLWKQGASVVINLDVRDPPTVNDVNSIDAGVYFADGRQKPSFTAWRFPFVTERASGKKLRAWGMSPVGGNLSIQVKHGETWRTAKKLKVGAGKVFSTTLRLPGRQMLRAVVGGERSLAWQQQR